MTEATDTVSVACGPAPGRIAYPTPAPSMHHLPGCGLECASLLPAGAREGGGIASWATSEKIIPVTSGPDGIFKQ